MLNLLQHLRLVQKIVPGDLKQKLLSFFQGKMSAGWGGYQVKLIDVYSLKSVSLLVFF